MTERKNGLVIEQSNGIRDGRKVARREGYDNMASIHIFEKARLLLLLFVAVKGGLEKLSKALAMKKVPRSAMSSICKRHKPKAVHVLL